MTAAQKAENKVTLPCGLENLGNTCYLNSTVQALRAAKDFKEDLKTWVKDTPPAQQSDLLGRTPDALARSFGTTIAEMDAREEPYTPATFVNSLRREFPKFAETDPRHGGYIQHDADEFLVELLNKINATVEINDGGSKKGIISKYFEGEYEKITKCDESDEKQTDKETFMKLQCFIDKETNDINSGVQKKLVEKIEKNSPALNRNAMWTLTRGISRNPKLLIVQMMRFFWKADINKSAKIRRKVAFPIRLDITDFCAPSLKEKILSYRNGKEKILEARREAQEARDKKEAEDEQKKAKAAEEAFIAGKKKMEVDEKEEPNPETKENMDVDNADDQKVEVVDNGMAVKIIRGVGPTFTIRQGDKVKCKSDPEPWTVSKLRTEDPASPTIDLTRGENTKNTLPKFVSKVDAEPTLKKPTGFYRIVGLVTHKGQSAASGHYIGYAREPGRPAKGFREKKEARWLKFDDEYTSVVDDAHMQQLYGGTGDMQMGYLCVYAECEPWEEDAIRG